MQNVRLIESPRPTRSPLEELISFLDVLARALKLSADQHVDDARTADQLRQRARGVELSANAARSALEGTL